MVYLSYNFLSIGSYVLGINDEGVLQAVYPKLMSAEQLVIDLSIQGSTSSTTAFVVQLYVTRCHR